MKIQHNASNVAIYFTRDYGLFKTMEGNRQLNPGKIKRIKEDICNGIDVLKYCPLIVHEKDGRLDIIDGQHRFYVAKELKSNVWYILAEEMSLQDIAKVNSNTEKWQPKDFINCYAVQGNKHYELLQDFMNETRFPLSVCLQLLVKGISVNDNGGSVDKSKFQSGQFEVKCESEARQVADIVSNFKEFPGYKSRLFVVALCRIMTAGLVEISEVIDAYAANKDKLKLQDSWKDYLVNLEAILNIGKRQRRVIYE